MWKRHVARIAEENLVVCGNLSKRRFDFGDGPGVLGKTRQVTSRISKVPKRFRNERIEWTWACR